MTTHRKTKDIETDARKIELLIIAALDDTTMKVIRPEIEARLKEAAERTPAAFDSILYPGAARQYLTGGVEAVRREFHRRYHGTAAGKSAGELVKHKSQRQRLQAAKERERLRQLGKADDPLLLADDATRLQALANALNVPQWGHDVLMLNPGMPMLERVYNQALATPSGKARKSTDPAIQRTLNRTALVEAGIPEAVLDALASKLGETVAHVYEALSAAMRTVKTIGAKAAVLKLKLSPPPARKQQTVNHPVFGRMKGQVKK